MKKSRRRVAILISGRGSNMAALIAAAIDPAFPAEIVGVISSRSDAKGLETAEKHSIATRVIAAGDFADRAAHEKAIHETLVALKAEIVCLAGYMRLLSADFVKRWQGRILNIHPALLPSFTGLDTHERALAAGVRIHGCTVHFVTQQMDDGPIIAQAAVPVVAGDTEKTLAARVLTAEHRLYPFALRLVIEGKARMSGARTVYPGLSEEPTDITIVAPGERRS